MIGAGTLINAATIIIGGMIGILFKHHLKEKYKIIMIQGVGLATLMVGISGTIQGIISSNNDEVIYMMILALVVGGVIGSFLKIEDRLTWLGDHLQKRFKNDQNTFSKGFVTASLIFCVGAMAIMGAIDDGLYNDYSILIAKSILDGIFAMILASTWGIGVIFSFIPVVIYQGSITAVAHLIEGLLVEPVKLQMKVIGSVLIVGIGLSILEIKKFKLADMLPAIFIPMIYYLIQIIY